MLFKIISAGRVGENLMDPGRISGLQVKCLKCLMDNADLAKIGALVVMKVREKYCILIINSPLFSLPRQFFFFFGSLYFIGNFINS